MMENMELAWLAGIWDADGCISLHKRAGIVVPTCGFTNTNKKLVDNVARILTDNGVKFCIHYQDRGQRKNAKPAWDLKIEGRPRVQKFLPLIADLLVGKNEQAKLVTTWCSLPKATSIGGGRGVGSVGVRYPDGYWEIRDQIQALNKRGRL
jgi:hypothetical protein